MLVIFIGRVVCRRLVVLCAGGDSFFFDKDVGDEIVNNGRTDGRISSRP